mgnify:CR=1 FL=1
MEMGSPKKIPSSGPPDEAQNDKVKVMQQKERKQQKKKQIKGQQKAQTPNDHKNSITKYLKMST